VFIGAAPREARGGRGLRIQRDTDVEDSRVCRSPADAETRVPRLRL